MIELIIYALTVFGIAWGFGHAHLSYPIRKRLRRAGFEWTVTLFECVGCSSFHLGWVAFLAGWAPPVFTSWFVSAFFTAASSLLLGHLAGLDRDEDQ